jgi:NAD(P)-dependent dehydrogenase (short-subunit alcohol dehydrogenase family)
MKNRRKVALVTGSSRGIGFGCAEYLAKAGFDLAINGVREEDDVVEALEKLRALGVDAVYCRGNIAVKNDRENMIVKIKKSFGCLHVLVNNAGVAPRQRLDILDATEESFDCVLGINLKGPYFLTQTVANWMIAQKKENPKFEGCIINVSSISAAIASVNRGEYCISKAGLSMASKLFAVRLGEFNIPVYEIRPGVTKTDMTAGVAEIYDQLIAEGLCVTKRWGYPQDVGKAVFALVCGQFPYSTGQVIMVDGGLTIPRL